MWKGFNDNLVIDCISQIRSIKHYKLEWIYKILIKKNPKKKIKSLNLGQSSVIQICIYITHSIFILVINQTSVGNQERGLVD